MEMFTFTFTFICTRQDAQLYMRSAKGFGDLFFKNRPFKDHAHWVSSNFDRGRLVEDVLKHSLFPFLLLLSSTGLLRPLSI